MVTSLSRNKDEHMQNMSIRLHDTLSTIEKQKRVNRMKNIKDAVMDIEASLLDYDETFTAPFVCYHIATTINNLTMLDPVIISSASEIGYNEDMSQWWLIYEERETDEWIRIDIDGTYGNIKLTNSNETSPTWTNASIADVIWMIRNMTENNGMPPDYLDSPTAVF